LEVANENGVWLFPFSLGGQNAALVAWRDGGALRNLSYVTLPPAGDRAADLKQQLALLTMAGEIEGWLVAEPKWHLVADPANAAEWDTVLRAATGEAAKITAPPALPELAARSARRAAATDAKVNLLPAEYTTRYHQQFVDRLWLHLLYFALAAYGLFLAVYFSGVAVKSVQTGKLEAQVAGLGLTYTNTMQLKARVGVLQDRAQLKYAALDCWKKVAEVLPEGINLQRFSFTDGKKLALSGNCTPEQMGLIADPGAFYDSVRKAQLNGQRMFEPDPAGNDQLVTRQVGNQVTWSFALDLARTEAATP
jgi:hypothetical protein